VCRNIPHTWQLAIQNNKITSVVYKYSYSSWWWTWRGPQYVDAVNKTDEIYWEHCAPCWFHLQDYIGMHGQQDIKLAIKASRGKAGGSIAPHIATVSHMTLWRQVNCYLWNYLSHGCDTSHSANYKLHHSSALIFDSSWTNTLVGLLIPEYSVLYTGWFWRKRWI